MKLNIYKNQNEIEKTYEVDAYDVMYGTVEDVLAVLDELGDKPSNDEIFKALTANRAKLNDLVLDIFPEMDASELRKVKLKEMIPFFLELFKYVKDSFSSSKN